MIPIRSKITEAMRRPDCIMGVTGDGGGSWLSPIRADGAQPTTLPAAAGQPWAIGSGMLKPQSGMVIDGAFEFIPGDENVRCGTALDLQGSTSSLTLWCRFELDEPAEQTRRWWPMLMAEGYPPAGSATCTPASLYLRRDMGKSIWSIFSYWNNGTSAQGISTDTAISYGTPHSVAVVRDVDALHLRLYLNGELIKTTAYNTLASPLVSGISQTYRPDLGMCIGAGLIGQNLTYEGSYRVYEGLVFDRALSAEEIAYLG